MTFIILFPSFAVKLGYPGLHIEWVRIACGEISKFEMVFFYADAYPVKICDGVFCKNGLMSFNR